MAKSVSNKRVKAEEIISKINAFFEINLKKRSRETKYVIPRFIACRVLKHNTILTLKEIARKIGYGEDHSMVIYAMKSLNDQMKGDYKIKDLVEEVEELFKQKK